MLKGVEAVAIHGSKSEPSTPPAYPPTDVLTRLALLAQEEREYAIKAFKTGKKDVMVASSIASKGLDFAEIQHVINFSMPKEIEVSYLLFLCRLECRLRWLMRKGIGLCPSNRSNGSIGTDWNRYNLY